MKVPLKMTKLTGKHGAAASRLYVIVYAKKKKRKTKQAFRPKKIPVPAKTSSG